MLLISPDHRLQWYAPVEGGQPAAIEGGNAKQIDIGDLTVRHSGELETVLVAQRESVRPEDLASTGADSWAPRRRAALPRASMDDLATAVTGGFSSLSTTVASRASESTAASLDSQASVDALAARFHALDRMLEQVLDAIEALRKSTRRCGYVVVGSQTPGLDQ